MRLFFFFFWEILSRNKKNIANCHLIKKKVHVHTYERQHYVIPQTQSRIVKKGGLDCWHGNSVLPNLRLKKPLILCYRRDVIRGWASWSNSLLEQTQDLALLSREDKTCPKTAIEMRASSLSKPIVLLMKGHLNPIALSTAKSQRSFGRSERNRVKVLHNWSARLQLNSPYMALE